MGLSPTSWKPGQVTNPNGRPKKEWTMAGLLRQALESKQVGPNGKKITAKEVITRKLVELAAMGDVVALKEINNRIDGMPTQKIDATISVPQPIYGGKSTELLTD